MLPLRERLRGAAGWFRQNIVDLLLLLLALALAWPSLLYPFGRDQGLYHYVGRGWFHGQLPYRDMMEQKTPLIYFIYGLANFLFGEHLSSIRVVELPWVLLLGWVLGWLATPRKEAPLPGLRGAGSLLCVLFYFGLFDFWDTAQCEVWAAGLALCSWALVERRAPERRALLQAGALAGLAILGKLPVLSLFPVLGLSVLEHGAREAQAGGLRGRLRGALVAGALYTAGCLAVLLATVLYFTLRGGFEDFYDLMVRLNLGYYRLNEATVRTSAEAWRVIQQWHRERAPFSYLPWAGTILGLLLGLGTRSWARFRRYLGAGALLLLSLVGIAGQQKFCSYHWGLFTLPIAPVVLFLAEDLARVFARWRRGFSVLAVLLALGVVGGLFARTELLWRDASRWYSTVLDYARRRITREQYLLAITRGDYDLRAQEVLADWLRAHTQPNEPVALRNFEPAIYLLAHRSAPTRFFWTPWLAWDSRAYRREEWLAQDAEQLRRNPPRYMVTVNSFHAGAESAEHYFPEYQPVFSFGNFSIVERTPRALDRRAGAYTWDGRPLRVVRDLGSFDTPDATLANAGWTLEGDAFTTQPTLARVAGQTALRGYVGRGLVNTFLADGGDRPTGRALSPAFTAEANQWLAFAVGGGAHGVGVDLLEGDTVLEQWAGTDAEVLRVLMVDLSRYAGRSLRVRLRDDASGGWGHLLFDHARVLQR